MNLVALGFWCIAAAASQDPVAVPVEAAVKLDQVQPLTVDFYDFHPKDAAGIDSMDIAKAYIKGHKPDFSYVLDLPAVDVPPGKTGSINPLTISLGGFLLGEKQHAKRKALAAKSKETSLPPRLDKPVGPRTIYVLHGFVHAAKAGAQKIRAPVDDDVEISIGERVVHSRGQFGGMTDPNAPENVSTVSFKAAGTYPVKIILYDRDPTLGLEIFSEIDPEGEIHDNGLMLLRFQTSASIKKRK